MTPTRVVLVDDHPFVRTGIRNILQRTPDIVVVGEAGDGFQALRLAGELDPDVLLLDMEMPGINGIQVTQQLHGQGADIPVLALSAHEDKQFILGMLASGAAGYLSKGEVPDTIVKAVRGVARGERGWVSRRVAARIAVWLLGEKPDEFSLNKQDVKILHLLLKGKSNEEIGASLGLSEEIVEIQLENTVKLVRQSLEKV